jgi:hypothetical protein
MTLKNGIHSSVDALESMVLTECWIDAFPASAAFDIISDSLSSSDAERKEAIQKGKAVFGFTLKNKEGKEESWYIDLKDTGKVSKEAPKKADGRPALSDN